ncbi:Tetratricopeptide repeat protein 39B [Manis javanica]|nr:Tetratricopeptide repeat protein 39B [Manis javanica]
MRRVADYESSDMDRKRASRDIKGPLPPVIDNENRDYVQTRMLSLRARAQGGVKTLELPKPVKGDPRPSRIQVSDCNGKVLTSATTDASGVARLDGLSPEPPQCTGGVGYRSPAYFVSARAQGKDGREELGPRSDWQRGIESWRFNVPTSRSAQREGGPHHLRPHAAARPGRPCPWETPDAHPDRHRPGGGRLCAAEQRPPNWSSPMKGAASSTRSRCGGVPRARAA